MNPLATHVAITKQSKVQHNKPVLMSSGKYCLRGKSCDQTQYMTKGRRSWPVRHNGHDDVIKWKHFPRYWPFVREIHRGTANGQWRGALMFPLICVRINGWINNHEAGDLRPLWRQYNDRGIFHYTDVTWATWCLKSLVTQLLVQQPDILQRR